MFESWCAYWCAWRRHCPVQTWQQLKVWVAHLHRASQQHQQRQHQQPLQNPLQSQLLRQPQPQHQNQPFRLPQVHLCQCPSPLAGCCRAGCPVRHHLRSWLSTARPVLTAPSARTAPSVRPVSQSVSRMELRCQFCLHAFKHINWQSTIHNSSSSNYRWNHCSPVACEATLQGTLSEHAMSSLPPCLADCHCSPENMFPQWQQTKLCNLCRLQELPLSRQPGPCSIRELWPVRGLR